MGRTKDQTKRKRKPHGAEEKGIKSARNRKEGNETGSPKGGRRKARCRRPATSGDRKEGQHDPATVVWESELGATLDGAAGACYSRLAFT